MSGCAVLVRCGPTSRALSAGPSRCASSRPARISATPASWSSPRSTRAAIEDMPEGCIAVVDAMGVTDAGIFGDILCARMKKRGVAALVTDGVVRDAAGVLGTGLPVWCQGVAAPPSVAGLTFVNWQEPIGCGGVAVYPGRCRGGRRGWCRADPGGPARRGRGDRARAGAARSLDHAGGRAGRCASGPLPARTRRTGRATRQRCAGSDHVVPLLGSRVASISCPRNHPGEPIKGAASPNCTERPTLGGLLGAPRFRMATQDDRRNVTC